MFHLLKNKINQSKFKRYHYFWHFCHNRSFLNFLLTTFFQQMKYFWTSLANIIYLVILHNIHAAKHNKWRLLNWSSGMRIRQTFTSVVLILLWNNNNHNKNFACYDIFTKFNIQYMYLKINLYKKKHMIVSKIDKIDKWNRCD